MPFSSTPGTLSMGSPSRTAATDEATRKARNGCTLPQLISSTSSTIDAEYVPDFHPRPLTTRPRDLSESRAFDVQADARQHVVRRQVQRAAVVAEFAVGGGLAVA